MEYKTRVFKKQKILKIGGRKKKVRKKYYIQVTKMDQTQASGESCLHSPWLLLAKRQDVVEDVVRVVNRKQKTRQCCWFYMNMSS